MLYDGQPNLYLSVVVTLKKAMFEWTAVARTRPLRTQLKTDRERRMTAGTGTAHVVVVRQLLGILSPTPSAVSPVMVTVPSKVLSTM